MQVEDFTSSLQDTPAVLLDNIRDQFNQRVGIPLSNLDEEFVTGITGIYQQALKENGLEDGIEVDGTINLLGYERDVSFSWQPDLLLNPDLVHWARGQSEELRQRVNYVVALLAVFYREARRQVETVLESRVSTLRDDYAQPVIDEATARYKNLTETLGSLRSNPVETLYDTLGG